MIKKINKIINFKNNTYTAVKIQRKMLQVDIDF